MSLLVSVACLSLPSWGCGHRADVRPGDIRSYRVPRGVERVASAAADGATVKAPVGGGLRLRYEVPEGWTDRGPGGMRLATVAIGAPADGHEITVIPASGTLRDNVARWQRQLDGEADEQSLGAAVDDSLSAAETVDVDGARATVVLLRPAVAGADGGQAILGAMIPLDDSGALFVKYKGSADVARRERDKFVAFVRSIRWK